MKLLDVAIDALSEISLYLLDEPPSYDFYISCSSCLKTLNKLLKLKKIYLLIKSKQKYQFNLKFYNFFKT